MILLFHKNSCLSQSGKVSYTHKKPQHRETSGVKEKSTEGNGERGKYMKEINTLLLSWHSYENPCMSVQIPMRMIPEC